MEIASLGILYNDYVRLYLNKRGPTGMWWNTDTISEATGTDPSVISVYRIIALDKAWIIYQETGAQATIEQLLDTTFRPTAARRKK